jgi:hypothetical protein
MSEFDTMPINPEEAMQSGRKGDSSSMHYQSSATNDTYRLAELESENSRLHRLVAELLIKNQQLRKQT